MGWIGQGGWIGWVVAAGALLLGIAGACALAHRVGAVALLDLVDRIAGGTAGTRPAAALPYGPHPAQTLEVVAPATPGPHPVLVFIHGGNWRSGAARRYRFVGRTFARAGCVVVLPSYRLVPDGIYPAMLEDGALALRWVRDHVARYGGDPARIALSGHSAGAYNAVMLALEPRWLAQAGVPDGTVKAVIGLAGPYDFYRSARAEPPLDGGKELTHPPRHRSLGSTHADLLLAGDSTHSVRAGFTSDAARDAFGHLPDPAISQPVAHARPDAPPIALITGDRDTVVKARNSVALARALTAAGRPTEATILPGLDHADMVITLAHPFRRDGRVREAVLRALAACGVVIGRST